MEIPFVTLSNNQKMPAIGLGTWQSSAGDVEETVKNAIDAGYRHFDCAMVYGNEKEIGEAIREKIAEGVIKRSDLFITSKLWNTSHETEAVVPACKKSLENFGLDYLDLYLIHWPCGYKASITSLFPDENEIKNLNTIDYIDTWKGMETCFELGLTKSIGVSNFNNEQLNRVMSAAKIQPVVNQVEVNPLINQKELIAFCKERDIVVVAYSPFGSPARPWAKPGDPVLRLDDPILESIGKKYGKTVPQVILRYLVEIGTVPIPKSSNKNRLIANLNIFDFKLSQEDIAEIDKFNCNSRVCPASELKGHKYYPFNM